MPARDSKGRFLKRSKQSTAIVRTSVSRSPARRAPSVITVRTSAAPARHKAKRRRGGGGSSTFGDAKQALGQVLYGGAYGWLANSAQTAAMLDKLPSVAQLGKHLTRGVILYYANKHTLRNKHIARIAIAAATVGGYALGAGVALHGGMSGGPAVIGGTIGDGDDLIGAMDDDSLGDDDLGDDDGE